jgi:hypothetical protein
VLVLEFVFQNNATNNANKDWVRCSIGLYEITVVRALGYKPEGRVFETRWGEILNFPNRSGHTRPWV